MCCCILGGGTTPEFYSSKDLCDNALRADNEIGGECGDNEGHIRISHDDGKNKEPGVGDEEIRDEYHSASAVNIVNSKPILVEEDGEDVNSKSHHPVDKDANCKQKHACDPHHKQNNKPTDNNGDSKYEKCTSGEVDDVKSNDNEDTTTQMKPVGDGNKKSVGKKKTVPEIMDCDDETEDGRRNDLNDKKNAHVEDNKGGEIVIDKGGTTVQPGHENDGLKLKLLTMATENCSQIQAMTVVEDNNSGKELVDRIGNNDKKLTGHSGKIHTTDCMDAADQEETKGEDKERIKQVGKPTIENQNDDSKNCIGNGGDVDGGKVPSLSGKKNCSKTITIEDCREKSDDKNGDVDDAINGKMAAAEKQTCRKTRVSRQTRNTTASENMSQSSEACVISSNTKNWKQELQPMLTLLLTPPKTPEEGKSEDMPADDGEGTNDAANNRSTLPIPPMDDAGEDDCLDWWPSDFMYGSNLLPIGRLVHILAVAKGLVDDPQKQEEKQMDEYAAIATRLFGRWNLKHADTCNKCGDGGKVYCCDFCHLVFHLHCIDRLQRRVILSSPLFACDECKKETQKAISKIMMHDATKAYRMGNSPRLAAFVGYGKRTSLYDVVSDFLEAIAVATGNELQIISNPNTTNSSSTGSSAEREIWQPLPYGHPPILPQIVLKLWAALERCKATWQPTLLKSPLPFGSWALRSRTTTERRESMLCLLTVAEISFTHSNHLVGNSWPAAAESGAELLIEVDYMLCALKKYFMSCCYQGDDVEPRTLSYLDESKIIDFEWLSNSDCIAYVNLRLGWLCAHRLMLDTSLVKKEESLRFLEECSKRLEDIQLSITEDGANDYPEIEIPLFHADPGPLHPISTLRAKELTHSMRNAIEADGIMAAWATVIKHTAEGQGREVVKDSTKQLLLGLSSRYDMLQINTEVTIDADRGGEQLSPKLEMHEGTADEILSEILKLEGKAEGGLPSVLECWQHSGKCGLSDGIGSGLSGLSMLLWTSAKLDLWGQMVSFAIDLLCRLGTCLLVSRKVSCITEQQQLSNCGSGSSQQLSNCGSGSSQQLEKGVGEKSVDDELLPSFKHSLLEIVCASPLTAEALCGLLSMCISSALEYGNGETVLLSGHNRLVQCIGWVMRLAGMADEYGNVLLRQGRMICNNAVALITSSDQANELKYLTVKGCAGVAIEIASVGSVRDGKPFSSSFKLKRCSTAIDALEAFLLSSVNKDWCCFIGKGVKESNPKGSTNHVPFPPSALKAIIFAGIGICQMLEVGSTDKDGCPLVVSGIYITFRLLSNPCLAPWLPRKTMLLAGSYMHSYLAERGLCDGGEGRFITDLCIAANGLQSDPSLDVVYFADQMVAQCHKCLYGISLRPNTEEHIYFGDQEDRGSREKLALSAESVQKVWPAWESMLNDTSKSHRSKDAARLLEAIENIDEFKDPPLTDVGTVIQDYLFSCGREERNRELLLNCSTELSGDIKKVLSFSSSDEQTTSLSESHVMYYKIYQSLYFHLAKIMGGIAFGKRKRGQLLADLEEGLQTAVWWHIKDLNFNPCRTASWRGLSCCLFALLGIVLDVYPVSCHDLGFDKESSSKADDVSSDHHTPEGSLPSIGSYALPLSCPRIPAFVSKGLEFSPLLEDLSVILRVSLTDQGKDLSDNIPQDEELQNMAMEGIRRAIKHGPASAATAASPQACSSSSSIPDGGGSVVKDKNDGGCIDEEGTKYNADICSCVSLTQHCVIMSFATLCARAHSAWIALADKGGDGDSSLAHAYESEASYLFVLARDVFHTGIVKGAKVNHIRARLLEKAELRLAQASDIRAGFASSSNIGEERASQLGEYTKLPSWHVPFMRAKIGLKLGKPYHEVLSYVLQAQKFVQYEKPFLEDEARDSCFQFLHSLRCKMAIEAEPSDEVLSLLEEHTYRPIAEAEDRSSQSLPSHLIRVQRQRAVLENVLRAMEEAGKRNKWGHRPMMCRAKCLLFLYPDNNQPAKMALSPLFDRQRIPQVVSVWREEGPAVKWKVCEQAGRKFHWIRRKCIMAWLDIVGRLKDRAAVLQLLHSAQANREPGDLAQWTAAACTKLALSLLEDELEEWRQRAQDGNNKTRPDVRNEECAIKELLSHAWEVFLSESENHPYPHQASHVLCDAYAQYLAANGVSSDAAPGMRDPLTHNCELLKTAQEACNGLFPIKFQKMKKIARSKLFLWRPTTKPGDSNGSE